MLQNVNSLAVRLALIVAACSWLGCSADMEAEYSAPREPGRVGSRGSEGERASDPAVSVHSLSDDTELVDPITDDELAAWLVADRKPANAADGPALGPAYGPPPKSVRAPAGKVARVAPKNAAKAAYGDKVTAKAAEPKLFDRWPKPKLAIVITGQQNGYLEPCGCAGLDNMKGGLMRRHTFIQSLEAADGYGWPAVVAVDLGNLVGRYGWQAEQKYDTAVQALKTMKYDAIGYGPDDLRLGLDSLLLAAADADGRFVAANLALSDWDASPTSRYRIIERGGYKVGVTAVLGQKYADGVGQGMIFKKPAADALSEVIPKLVAARCDVMILLSHATIEESKALAKRFPQFQIVVTAGGPDEPPLTEEKLPGTGTWLIESGRKGMYLQVIGVFDDARTPRRFQRVPIDARFKDSPDIKKLMIALQKKYEEHYKLGAMAKDRSGWEGLGIRPLSHPTGRTFVGSKTCGECHTKAYAKWSTTGHAHATETLEKLEIPRTFDPECVSCHATGWEPQKYFPFKGGFESVAKTEHLTTNGCENCHSPGSRHVAIEMGELEATKDERVKAREQMRVTKAQAKANVCAACHDLDNSPDYIKHGFEVYWPKIEHKGKD